MRLSKLGAKLIKSFEGFREDAYLDSADVPTIGYGTTRYSETKPVKMGDKITRKEANKYFLKDIRWAQRAVNKHVSRDLKQYEFDALVSLVYNIGEQAFLDSTLLRRLNGDYPVSAANEFIRWVEAGGQILRGLIKRRVFERDMFLGRSMI